MKVYQVKIAPPLPLLTDKEQMKARGGSDHRRKPLVDKFVERITGIIRDVKH
jgi:hypothetical protein